jgi:hypothetical protein
MSPDNAPIEVITKHHSPARFGLIKERAKANSRSLRSLYLYLLFFSPLFHSGKDWAFKNVLNSFDMGMGTFPTLTNVDFLP